MVDVREQYIAQVAAGGSFAEVGGLWGALSEKVSVAHNAGAAGPLAMFDIAHPTSQWWTKFEERRTELSVPHVHCVSGDVMQLTEAPGFDRYDVVHCSGVLYHVPDQLRLLGALKKLASKYVILTSVVTATRIENQEGVLEVPQGGALFVPALQGRERAIVRAHWAQVVGDRGAIGLTFDPPRWDVKDYAPWWWIPTASALEGMCAAAGFEVVSSESCWYGNALTLLLRVPAVQ